MRGPDFFCPCTREFCHYLAGLSDGALLEAYVHWRAAPTIEGIKAATMLCFTRGFRASAELWRKYGAQVSHSLGLEWRLLAERESSLTVLLYRAPDLAARLQTLPCREILGPRGYGGSLEKQLTTLATRSTLAIPDEVGCFLDYPAHDVAGFLLDRGRSSLFCDQWCVYADPAGARELARRIRTARREAMFSTLDPPA